MDDRFWLRADELVATSKVVIDWPRGRERGGRPYPLDYGYLDGTSQLSMTCDSAPPRVTAYEAWKRGCMRHVLHVV